MKTSDFDFTYPPELVATHPAPQRDASRMMVINRKKQLWEHSSFEHFPDYFKKGDLLIYNDSRVLPCRLITRRASGGKVECLLLREQEHKEAIWEVLLIPSKKIKKDEILNFGSQLQAILLDEATAATRTVKLRFDGSLSDILQEIGHIPLPPYLNREDIPQIDQERYQTIYAQKSGSAAAPTAGFHFTEKILDQIKQKGALVSPLTLHVGIGTFFPIRHEEIARHQMHGEYYEIPLTTSQAIIKTRQMGGTITAIGTTTVRALESAWDEQELIKPGPGYTEKFIKPPYSFKLVDRLLTNFHQPRSSLLVLVSTLASRDLILQAYQEAISLKYRLFSYGDCMLIE